jgi:hypothetical protein
MNKTQEWLEKWSDNATFTSQDDLTKLVFKDILKKFTDSEVYYGPNESHENFKITIKDSDGLGQIIIPLSE